MEPSVTTEKYLVEIERDLETGNVLRKAWMTSSGDLHRAESDLPALRKYDPDTGVEIYTAWYKSGLLHRGNDEPAEVYRDLSTGHIVAEHWRDKGNFHRPKDKPAMIVYNIQTRAVLSFSYFKNNIPSRDNGMPTYIRYGDNGEVLVTRYLCDDKNNSQLYSAPNI